MHLAVTQKMKTERETSGIHPEQHSHSTLWGRNTTGIIGVSSADDLSCQGNTLQKTNVTRDKDVSVDVKKADICHIDSADLTMHILTSLLASTY